MRWIGRQEPKMSWSGRVHIAQRFGKTDRTGGPAVLPQRMYANQEVDHSAQRINYRERPYRIPAQILDGSR